MKGRFCHIAIKIYVWFSRRKLDNLYRISVFLSHMATYMCFLPFAKTIRRNLRVAFPEKNKAELRETEKKYYNTICDFAVESMKTHSFSCEDITRRVEYKNLDILLKLLKEYKYVVCYSGHVANYEWMIGLPLSIPGYRVFNYYMPVGDNNPIEKFIKDSRSKYGATLIPVSSPLRELLCAKNDIENGISDAEGFVLGSLADMGSRLKNSHKINFLGQTTGVQTGTERVGRKLGAAFVYGKILRKERGYYEIELQELSPMDANSNKYAYTEEFYRQLEKNIKEYPELWLMWGNYGSNFGK